MKRFFLFAMMCIVGLFGSLNAQTQVDISVGEGTNYQQVIPNQEYYNYSVSHQIYTADEMQNLSGTITSIAFKQASASVLARSLSIYMLNTDKESFSSTSDWFALTADNLVYSGSVTYPGIKDGWITYELSTPFEYTGGNLAVCVYDNTGSWVNASSFYTYETGASPRSLYKAQDGAAFTFDNIYSYQGSYVPYTWGSVFQNNQVEFGITITGEYKLLTVAPSTIELGNRPNGAWMRPAELVLGTRGGDINIAFVESTNQYFEVSGADMPATVKKGEPVVLEVEGTQGIGDMSGQLLISYDNARSIELVDVTAFAYTPGAGDVYETATAITSYPFTATPDYSTIYDNYLLPGSEEDGKDVVYEMNFTSDVVLSANVTGENGKVAVYAEDFGGEDGPMAYNNYEGPEVGYAPIPARPSFSFDFEWANTEGWDFIDADGDGFDWMSSYYAFGMGYGHNSDFCMTSLAWYNDALNPDDYMVTEEKYAIFPNSELSFWVCTATDSPDEHYGVAISTDGENFTTIFEETYGEWKGGQRNRDQGNGLTDWREIVVPLADYAGQEVYIALRHFDSYDKFVLCVDDVKLSKYASKRGNAISNLVLPAGKYYLVASSTGEFTVNVNKEAITAPAKPTAPSPANFAQNITEPTLSWEFGANTVEYQLLLGTTYPPKEVVVDWTDNLEIGHKIYELYNNKNYFWRVNTRNSSGTTYGDVWSFTTTFNVPQELALTTDKVYEGETTTLSWAQVSDRSYRGYNIYVNGEKVNEDIVKETSFVLENLPYNMDGNEVKVSAVYDEGESAMSEAAYVYVTGMSSVAGNFYEQDKVTPVIGGIVYITGTDEFGTAQSYTFVADENGAYEGEILAGKYVAIASVEGYQNNEVEFKAKYDETSVVDFSMTEFYNPVKYITATETEEAVELVWGMQRYTTGTEDFESGDFSMYPWNNEVSEYPFAITTDAYEGEYAMKSTCEGIDYGVSAIELTLDVPFSGVVGFYYKVSCEAVYD
ncbi:MAG: choice-of-anchor J domain-containing protein, partial [Bacteroidales bacterium]|nr:choice-of-anchor J domain-containing protein [Bacteroidales bacterium]